MSKNLSNLSGRKGLQHNLYELLGNSAEANEGTPNPKDLKRLAKDFLMGRANTYGAASFYDFLKPENKGKKVYYCNGSSCMTAGTQNKVMDKLKSNFKEEEIGHICCLGRCHENSSFHYEGKNYSGDSINQIDEIIQQKTKVADAYTIGHSGPQILTGNDLTLDEVKNTLKDIFRKGRETILSDIKASGLRGRGGAGFPIGFKLESAKNTPSDSRFIVCNADEGDPGAYSDRYLMSFNP